MESVLISYFRELRNIIISDEQAYKMVMVMRMEMEMKQVVMQSLQQMREEERKLGQSRVS
jgi:hypothetical protein